MRQSHLPLILVVSLLAFAHPGAINGQLLDLSLKGHATVTIGPPDAVVAGAAFSIDELPFQGSGGVESGLDPGGHSVRFQPIPGWIEPPEEK